MRYGILSDIHGNLEALQAVVAACKEQGIRKYFCVGDIVGYGANPIECIEEINKLKTVSVAGNHDWAVSGKLNPINFSQDALSAVHWTRNHIRVQQLDFLNQLELEFIHDDFQMVHGSLNNPQEFEYLKDLNQSLDTFYLMKRNVCFVGHTHIPQILIKKGDQVKYSTSFTVELEEKNDYIINAGSVGQPRDGNPDAAYCIFDPDLNRIEVKRIKYDVALTQKKILEAGLPTMLAQRLAIGH